MIIQLITIYVSRNIKFYTHIHTDTHTYIYIDREREHDRGHANQLTATGLQKVAQEFIFFLRRIFSSPPPAVQPVPLSVKP